MALLAGLLELDSLSRRFGTVTALDDLSFSVHSGLQTNPETPEGDSGEQQRQDVGTDLHRRRSVIVRAAPTTSHLRADDNVTQSPLAKRLPSRGGELVDEDKPTALFSSLVRIREVRRAGLTNSTLRVSHLSREEGSHDSFVAFETVCSARMKMAMPPGHLASRRSPMIPMT